MTTIGPKLAAALLAAQRQIVEAGGVKKTAENPHFKSSFADRPSVLDAVLPILNANGISVLQLPTAGPEGHLSLTTFFIHESGESVEGQAIVPLSKADPQGYGSAITYTSRYALVVGTGIKTLDDDDGEAASGRSSERPSKPAGGFPGQPKPAASKGFPGSKPAGKTETAAAPERKKKGLFPVPAGKASVADESGDEGSGEEGGDDNA